MAGLLKPARAWLRDLPEWLTGIIYVMAAVIAAVILHRVLIWIARRATRAHPEGTGAVFVERINTLSRWRRCSRRSTCTAPPPPYGHVRPR